MRIMTMTLAVMAVTLCSCSQKTPLSVRMVESEMSRCPSAKFLDFKEGKEISWNYTTGLEQKAFLDVYDRYGDTTIFNYVEAWYDEAVCEDGKPQSYKVKDYSVDKICAGKTLFQLYALTGKDKYRMAMDTLMFQYLSHPRTSEGALWHKNIYPHQVWLDGLYMAQPFAAEYFAKYTGGDFQKEKFDEIISDFEVTERHTYDSETGLYRHAWDESRQMFWCDTLTGQSQHCWCRALGWAAMAIVDVLDWIPEGTERRNVLTDWLEEIVDVLPRYADPKTGMWYQVMDCPGREGNYLESTGSAMFVYAMLKGCRKGYLDKDVLRYAIKSYRRFVKTFISYDGNGLMDINQCCSVGGLGGKQNRMGDYAYYLSEPIRSNDPKGVGPFIWASLEYEGMQ